jgi:hypothetical protein
MRVRTIHEHGNAYGPAYQKKKGAEYDAPERTAKNLIDTGMVEEVEAAPAKKRRTKKSA